jgi:hypothetical protein
MEIENAGVAPQVIVMRHGSRPILAELSRTDVTRSAQTSVCYRAMLTSRAKLLNRSDGQQRAEIIARPAQ